MFQKVDAYAGDPILSLMERFKEDYIEMFFIDPRDYAMQFSQIKRLLLNPGPLRTINQMIIWCVYQRYSRCIDSKKIWFAVRTLGFIKAFKHPECNILVICIIGERNK